MCAQASVAVMSENWWLQAYLYDLQSPHVELARSTQFYSICALLFYLGLN